MKVALIGDIHGNLPALEKVLGHAHAHGAESIWNVGDSVGSGPFPDEVVQRLRQDQVLSALGSQDRKILRFTKRQARWRKSKNLKEYLAYKWAYEHLSKKSRKYLRSLSREVRMKVKGKNVLLTHVRPGPGKKGLRPETPEKELRQVARQARADLIVCGHTHQPLARQVDEVWFFNPGSVGEIMQEPAQASYALLTIQSQDVDLEHHLVEYDVEPLIAAMRDRGFPDILSPLNPGPAD
jgi:putative phosphoesterase